MKPREFWFDLETTSENEPVVNDIHFEKPDFETDFHVIEKSEYDSVLELNRFLKERFERDCEYLAELEKKLEIAETELKRMLHANYISLLEATAYMGIPEKKRDAFIESHLSNAKFICEKALEQIKGGSE